MSPRGHRAIVFVVDDEDVLREALRELLEGDGYLVLGARDGSEALARMRGIAAPAVAIVDLTMPGMDGRQLIARMRADIDLAWIPVIVLTAHSAECVEGATAVLGKQQGPPSLLDTIHRLCP